MDVLFILPIMRFRIDSLTRMVYIKKSYKTVPILTPLAASPNVVQ